MKTIIAFFLITISLFSCKKDHLIEAFILTDDELQYIQAFSDKEISFINSSNAEILAFPAAQITFTTRKQLNGVNTQNYYEYQISTLHLSSANITIFLTLNSLTELYHDKPELTIEWGQIDSDSLGAIGGTYVPMDTNDLGNKLIQYDSLTINSKVYYDVFKGPMRLRIIHDNDTILEPATYPIEYFYDKQYGIIKFNMSDSTSLEIM